MRWFGVLALLVRPLAAQTLPDYRSKSYTAYASELKRSLLHDYGEPAGAPAHHRTPAPC